MNHKITGFSMNFMSMFINLLYSSGVCTVYKLLRIKKLDITGQVFHPFWYFCFWTLVHFPKLRNPPPKKKKNTKREEKSSLLAPTSHLGLLFSSRYTTLVHLRRGVTKILRIFRGSPRISAVHHSTNCKRYKKPG